MTSPGDWSHWRAHVLAELQRGNENFARLTIAVSNLHVETAKLQVKAGIWGVIGGAIPVLVLMLVQRIK